MFSVQFYASYLFLEKAVCAHGTKIPSDLSSTEITVIIVISDLCTFYQLD